MESRPTIAQRPADWLARAIVSGLVATTAMLVTFMLTYALAAFFASMTANGSASGQMMGAWFKALTSHRLIDLGQSAIYGAMAVQLALAIAAAIVYAAIASRWSQPGWASGLLFSLPLALVSAVVLLPAAGYGLLGLAIGAGPLPFYGLLLSHLVYGLVLGAVYGLPGDRLFGPETPENVLASQQTMRGSAGGILIGLLLGALAGLALAPLMARPGQTALIGLSAMAPVLAFALAGGGLGALLGSMAGLPVAPVPMGATVASMQAGAGLAGMAPVGMAAFSASPWEEGLFSLEYRPTVALRQLQIVAVNGVCQQGHKMGDTFTCTANGELTPGLCPIAARALQPLLTAMVQGHPDAPRRVACPIHDHMLVLQLA